MAKALMQMNDIDKSFGNQQVLNGINMVINEKEIVGLIGPSGAGKSTIIKIMLGMEIPDGGSTTMLEHKMPNRQLLGRIGYMAQSDALYETLTGRENLKFFAKMKGVKSKEVNGAIEHAAEVVELTDNLGKRVSGYSGGMKRRLSLAIALLGDPEVLILDEPTVGIDPALRRKIWAELRSLKDQGRTILITTHVMDEAELTDRVALLLGGKLIDFDQPEKLKEKYQVNTIEDVFLKAEGDLQ